MTNIPIQEPAVYPCNGCQHQLFREVNAVVNAGPLALHVLIWSIPDEEDFRQVYENMVGQNGNKTSLICLILDPVRGGAGPD